MSLEANRKLKEAELIDTEEGSEAMVALKNNQSSPDPEEWTDKNGDSVRVYGVKDRMTPLSYKGPTLGHVARAMIYGARNEEEKRALAEGADNTGGVTVPNILGLQFIDRLRAKSRVMQAGAKTITLTSDNYSLAKLVAGATVTWREENAEIQDTQPVFGKADWVPRWVGCWVPISRELLQDSINIEQTLNKEFSEAMASEFDHVALLGTGVAPQPKGINLYSNALVESMGTDGAEIANYSPILNTYEKLLTANNNDPTAAIMSTRSWRAFAGLTATDGQPLMRPEAIKNLPFYETSKIPNNLVQGGASDASTIFLGDFTQLYFGFRFGVRIELVKDVLAKNFQYAFMVWARVDVVPYHEQSFCKITGVIPA